MRVMRLASYRDASREVRMQRSEASCRVCKAPFRRFTCTSCLANDVKARLPATVHNSFDDFTLTMNRVFHQERGLNLEHCSQCTRLVNAHVCQFCYIVETTRWLSQQESTRLSRASPIRHGLLSSALLEELEGG